MLATGTDDGLDELCQKLFLIFVILGQKKIFIIISGQKHLQKTGAVAPDQQVRENICIPVSVKCILYIYSVKNSIHCIVYIQVKQSQKLLE